jgi:hypothetical protein
MKLSALVTLALTLLLTGCNEYKSPLCNEKNRVDVPGLEGSFAMVIQNAEKFVQQKSVLPLKRVEVGLYQIGAGTQGQKVSTCTVGDRTLFETRSQKNQTYTSYMLSKTALGFTLTFGFFDKNALDQAKVPYAIVERAGDAMSRMFSDEKKDKALVVDNSSLDPEAVVKLLIPTSLSLQLFHQ